MQERKHIRLVKQIQPRPVSLLFHELKSLVPLSEVHLVRIAPDRCAHTRLHQERLNIMRASAESLHGLQVNRKLSTSPTTYCRDEEQYFWSAALSRRGVHLAPRSLVHTSHWCSSIISLCRLVLIGASVKYRPLTCSERLEYVLHRTSNPLGLQDGRAFSLSDLRAVSLAPPYRFAHVTAAKLSPSIKDGSPLNSGRSPTSSCMTHAVSTFRLVRAN